MQRQMGFSPPYSKPVRNFFLQRRNGHLRGGKYRVPSCVIWTGVISHCMEKGSHFLSLLAYCLPFAVWLSVRWFSPADSGFCDEDKA